jgi:lysine 2,3-aminomutase
MPAAPSPSTAFRRRHFPGVTAKEWNDWRWQHRHRIQHAEELAALLTLSVDESAALRRLQGRLPLAITPYYAALLHPSDPSQGLRRTVVPAGAEFVTTPGELRDPLDEDAHSPVPGLVHRYPDRALLLVTNTCATYCRYCTRSRMVGASEESQRITTSRLEGALAHIAATPAIRDVLISGGDPLVLSDARLDWLLGRLDAMPHVRFVRLGTKIPFVMPQRITAGLARVLRRHRPIWMSLHINHPAEITPESARACHRLADAGVPLGAQTVLLRGVNDDLEILRELLHGLLEIRVKPYYLLQCDPIPGSAHFRTPVHRGLELLAGLQGHTSGYAVPAFVLDAPQGGGKIRLVPEHIVGREGGDLLFTNYEGRLFRYPDAGGTLGEKPTATPADAQPAAWRLTGAWPI